MGLEFEQHLLRQIAFSRATFGPGARRDGVVDHIRKELVEVESADDHHERIKEWVDVVLLALDGLWREIAYGGWSTRDSDDVAPAAVEAITRKLRTNEIRDWPDWRTADRSKAIEHVRTEKE